MARLPSDAELRKLFAMGITQTEIADQHGVTLQAVNLRFHKIGVHRVPYARETVQLIDSIWPERRGREHHGRTAELIFRAFVRRQLGDDQLSLRQRQQAAQFANKIIAGAVLTYEIDSEEGWSFIPRVEEDMDWVVRYPADFAPAPGLNYRALMLKRSES